LKLQIAVSNLQNGQLKLQNDVPGALKRPIEVQDVQGPAKPPG
jgi:hypothetical protein